MAAMGTRTAPPVLVAPDRRKCPRPHVLQVAMGPKACPATQARVRQGQVLAPPLDTAEKTARTAQALASLGRAAAAAAVRRSAGQTPARARVAGAQAAAVAP